MRVGGGKKLIWLIAVAAFHFAPDHVRASKNHYFQGDICRQQTRLQERASQIPDYLLTAISLTETGRWIPERRAMFAWPWTVTANGKGAYYETKQEAIEAVKALKTRGINSIDVGCMQINLLYHPRAFKTLEDAFNVERNVSYASHFLGSLYEQTKSWRTAAAHYHSTNPAVNRHYQKKVLKIWIEVGGTFAAIELDRPIVLNPTDERLKRAAQLELFDARFRARLDAERGLTKPERGQSFLDAWRAGRGKPSIYSQFSARRRAERERIQRAELRTQTTDFAAKRRSQLTAWRIRSAQISRERRAAADADKLRRRR